MGEAIIPNYGGAAVGDARARGDDSGARDAHGDHHATPRGVSRRGRH